MSLFAIGVGGTRGQVPRSSLPSPCPCASASKNGSDQPSAARHLSWWNRISRAPCGPVLQTAHGSLRQDCAPAAETRLNTSHRGEAAQTTHPEPAEAMHREPSAWISGVPQKRAADPGQLAWPALFDCLFPPEEQSAELDVGFPGTGRQFGQRSLSRIKPWRAKPQDGAVATELSDIQAAAGAGDTPITTSSAGVSRGTWSLRSAHPRQMLRHGSLSWLDQSPPSMPHCCCPISTSRARAQEGHGRPCRSTATFSSISDAALQYLRSSGYQLLRFMST